MLTATSIALIYCQFLLQVDHHGRTCYLGIRNLDRLGLVAALLPGTGHCPHDRCLAPQNPPFKVSHGEALVAMIVNGLGFHSSTLHMFPQFFANKPVERLVGQDLC